uniref:2OG-Fe(II) oxygenase superfamily protein n=1 Tax=Marseillevirus LCMAC102 TaxID=2506603 RepID=A0A481YT19_9VIRU|nr:MAG: 2OG-Fe(II) oxygenase superfamily protein [Marseillevirus LCMAC102]
MNQTHLEKDNITNYLETFKKDKVVVVPNFLNEEWANKLFWFLDNMNENWWHKATFGDGKKKYTREFQNEITTCQIQKLRLNSMESFKQKKFSYTFSRTINDHIKNCVCVECKFKQDIIRNPKIIRWLADITGHDITVPTESFCSKYTSRDFLSIHTDEPKGKIAFVLNMTKDWNPVFGGNLHILAPGNVDVEKVLVPKFNNISIFDISDGGKPHFVSHVVEGVQQKRISYTGWYN